MNIESQFYKKAAGWGDAFKRIGKIITHIVDPKTANKHYYDAAGNLKPNLSNIPRDGRQIAYEAIKYPLVAAGGYTGYNVLTPVFDKLQGNENLRTETGKHVGHSLNAVTALITGAALAAGKPSLAATALLSLAPKDMLVHSTDLFADNLNKKIEQLQMELATAAANARAAQINKERAEREAVEAGNLFSVKNLPMTILAASALLGGGIYGLHSLFNKQTGLLAKKEEPKPTKKIKVTLPTADKNDQETVVELDANELSANMQAKLKRDAMRRLRKELEERTYRRAIEKVVSEQEGVPWSATSSIVPKK